MKKMMNNIFRMGLIVAIIPASSYAQIVVNDTLTGASSSYGWQAQGGACLTAGDGKSPSTIPACNGNSYYANKTQVGGDSGRLPDPIGKGALRLTNGDVKAGGSNGDNSSGSVVSTETFPTGQGVQITFATATYGGDGFANNNSVSSGADGIAFFLMDGSKPPSVGAFGGSLGYSCSQGKNPADGVDGGYLGVAVDEFGNFSNPGDATSTGPGQTPGSVVVRGSGSITWASLKSLYTGKTISAANQLKIVQETCRTGKIQNYSNGNVTSSNTKIANYDLLAGPQKLTVPIFNQEGISKPLRKNANILTYALKITQDGLLSLSYSANGGVATPVITERSIIEGNGPLPGSFRFGFTAGTGSGSNVHEILCFKATQINTSNSSAGSNVRQTSRVEGGSQVYLAYYHPLNSWGQLTASNLVADDQDVVSVSSRANWDANCVLTGGSCSTTNGTNSAQTSGSRNVLSWNGTKGISFAYDNLTDDQKAAIGGATDGVNRIAYLRGDRTKELTSASTGVYRKRDGVLGDIMNASPVWVSIPTSSYAAPAGRNVDALSGRIIDEFMSDPADPKYATSYAKFASDNQTRTHVVYSGSNDGMLHGFRAGAYNSLGDYSSTLNDGKEAIAYVPDAVVRSIHSTQTELDFSSPQYAHNHYVDATPGTGDLFYDGKWHTWLVGGLGAGGNIGGAINDAQSSANGVLYALDITDPSKFLEGNANDLVIGEWNSSNLACSADVTATCKNNLGSVYGTPIIRLLHDGNWAVIFGNGRNSATGAAGIFVMSVDRDTGAQKFRFLDTGTSSTTNKNGIDYVTSADLDGDHVTDYLYAGDAAGNVWRFDLTSSNPSDWKKDYKLFQAPAGEPISTQVTVGAVAQPTGAPRVMIAFGTGRQSPQTLTSDAVYASGDQFLYGLWDWNMNTWNGKSGSQYVTLTAPQSYTSTNLQAQTATDVSVDNTTISGYRKVTQNAVCWKGSQSGCTQFGWKMKLPVNNEQVIYNPSINGGLFLINTMSPEVTETLSCDQQPATGFTMALDLATGGAPDISFFDPALKSILNITNTSGIAGVALDATGSSSLVRAGDKWYLVQQTKNAQPKVIEVNPAANGTGRRLTWVKLR